MSSVARSAPVVPAAPSFIGRRADLQRLQRAFEEAVRGRSQLVVVSGPAGIGKSALVRRSLGSARRAAAQVIVGECAEQDASLPFAALFGAAELRSALGSRRDEQRPLLEGPDRSRTFAAIFERLRTISRERAVVLVIEDLQWADRETLDLLPYLSRRATNLPLLVVATVRSDDIASTYPADRLSELRRRAGLQLEVAPLTPHEVGALVQAILGPTGRPDQHVRSFAVERAGGNPLFVEEIVRSLVEHRWLALADGVWRLSHPLTDAVLPTSIGASIRARLRLIPAAERRILASAAVVGQRFAFDLLVEITGRPREDVIRALHAGIDAQLLEEGVGDTPGFTFRHALFRDALLDDLIAVERADLHRAVGAALEAATAEHDRASVAHELAIHFDAAGDAERALRYHLLAARVAQMGTWPRVGAFMSPNPGASHLERALSLAPADHPDRYEMLRAYAWAQDHPARRMALIEESLRLARTAGDQRGIAVSTLLAGVWRAMQGDPSGAAGIREGIRSLEPFGPSADLADAYFQLARVAMLDGDPDAVALSERAVRLAREQDLPALLAQSLATLGPALVQADRPEGLAVSREALALAREHGTGPQIGRCLANLWNGLQASGASDGELRAVESEIETVAPRNGDRISWTFLDGDWGRVIAIAEELGAPPFDPMRMYIAVARDGPAALIPDILREHERNQRGLLWRGMSLATEILYMAGEHRLALSTGPYVARCIERRKKLPLVDTTATAALAAAVSVGEEAAIDEWIERCARQETVEPITAEGRRQYARGEHARREGHIDDALDALARSAAAFERRGATLLARTLPRIRRAELLAETDAVAAQKELATVMAMWRAVGATWYLARLREWADAHGLRGWTVSARRGARLTPRETEVARRIADGLTNKEIASALGITERTAETHVQRILTKLDLRSRARLAAWVGSGPTARA